MAEKEEVEVWLCPRLLFDSGRLVEGAALGLAGGRVAEISRASALPPDAPKRGVDGLVSPGFVDLQVNGGGGVLLNETPTKKAMWDIAKAHRAFGTTAILPTVITDAPDKLARAADAVIEAFGHNGVYGLHIEGPHISVDRRGTHKAEFVRPPDATTLNQIAKIREAGVPTLVTLAPDVVEPSVIEKITAMGAVVSIGHSKATAETVNKALAAGASCFTHLFNAMSPMTGREPGVVGAAINSDVYVGIICDGVHVADEMIALAIRARPVSDRMFIVSDAMPTVGGPPEFDLYGSTVLLENNRLVNVEGSLAGAHTTQAESVKRLVDRVGLSPEEALRMAITIPANAMGLDLDRVQDSTMDNLICLDGNLNFTGTLKHFFADPANDQVAKT